MSNKTNINKAFRQLEMKIDKFEENIYDALSEVGKETIMEAKTAGSYKDDTGRMRNSNGYSVTNEKGEIIEMQTIGEMSPVHASTVSPLEGAVLARNHMKRLPKAKGISLTYVNGAPYASFVESREFNVSSSAQLLMERKLEQILK